MLKHIVMWKLHPHAEGHDKVQNALKMKALLESCKSLVPGILNFEVALAHEGIKDNLEATYDVILYSEFIDKAALDAYQEHPEHNAIKPFIAAVREARQCMDYPRNSS